MACIKYKHKTILFHRSSFITGKEKTLLLYYYLLQNIFCYYNFLIISEKDGYDTENCRNFIIKYRNIVYK